MKKLTIVFSAPAMMRLIELPFMKDDAFRSIVAACMADCIQKIRNDCKEIMGVNIGIDILYNAFTEPNNGKFLNANNRFGFDRLHADSGGLQVLTLGKEMNRNLMEQVYEDQSFSDIAMAFDEIPAKDQKVNNRASIATRMYYPSMANECVTVTAQNINSQCQYFNGKNARAMFITQGNSMSDVVKWFDTGNKLIDPKLWQDKICGIAMGGGCMGTGEQETLDNMIAWMVIHKRFGTDISKNLIHLLGYGAANRLAPAIALFKSKAFPNDIELSFDSSSLSMKYMMGGSLNENGGSVSLSDYISAKREFETVLAYYKDIIEKHIGKFDFDEVLTHLTENRKSIARTQKVDVPNFQNVKYDVARVFIPAYIVYQALNLFRSINNAIEKSTLLQIIQNLQTMEEILTFYDANKHRFTTNRVYRHGADLQEFFA